MWLAPSAQTHTITDKSEVACQNTARGVNWIYELPRLSEKNMYPDDVNYQLWLLMNDISGQTQTDSLSVAESSQRCSACVLSLNYTHTFISKSFQRQRWINGPCRQGWEESEGAQSWDRERIQSCCCCKTGQTGLRRTKRHREQHWAISSQSGCTGLMGEGSGLTTATFLFLSSWQHDVSGVEIFFLFIITYHKIINSTMRI